MTCTKKNGCKTCFLVGELDEKFTWIKLKILLIKGKENLLCLVKKYLCGLKCSLRKWCMRFDNLMLDIGLIRCNYDNYLYFNVKEIIEPIYSKWKKSLNLFIFYFILMTCYYLVKVRNEIHSLKKIEL